MSLHVIAVVLLRVKRLVLLSGRQLEASHNFAQTNVKFWMQVSCLYEEFAWQARVHLLHRPHKFFLVGVSWKGRGRPES